jgi:hypothetical protein
MHAKLAALTTEIGGPIIAVRSLHPGSDPRTTPNPQPTAMDHTETAKKVVSASVIPLNRSEGNKLRVGTIERTATIHSKTRGLFGLWVLVMIGV